MATAVEKLVSRPVEVYSQPGKLLGIKSKNLPEFLKALTDGLPWAAASNFLKVSGFTQEQLAKYLAIPERTLARRKEAGSLNQSESERLMRLAEIYEACLHLFSGNKDEARSWLTTPAFGLNYARPIDFAQSEFGAREVRNLIGRIEYGVYS
jgi:putative toxin-antitoxin system antitoxin component (TIGR02293 family)